MRRSPKASIRRRQRHPAARITPKVEDSGLTFRDLEVPVRTLLTLEEERVAGRRIRSCLARLADLLPRHPEGYRRLLARMDQVLAGGAPMFSWFPLSHRLEADLTLATQALHRAEASLEASHRRALRHYDEGAKILRKYILDPETLAQWAREIGGSLSPARPLSRLPELQRVDRLVRKLTEALERQRDRLVLPNFRLVLKEVFRYRPIGMMRSDLFQEGIIGLHKAIFRYDPERGTRFSTYATFWIRQSMRKCLTDRSRLIRVPQAVQEELRKEAGSLGPPERERVRRLMRDTILFSYGEADDASDRFAFEIKDPSVPELGDALRTHRMPRAVEEALDSLNHHQREVLQRRFGLAGGRPQTLEEIGIQLNLSRERIRQIEQDAMARMRKREDLWDVYEDLGKAQVTTAATHN